MSLPDLSEYTESEFLDFVSRICQAEYPTEKEQIEAVLLFEELTEHPDGSDLIYYADSDEESSPQAIVNKVKQWRESEGKPGFKTE